MAGISFDVADQPIAQKAMDRIDVRSSVQSLLQRKIEQMDVSDPGLVSCMDSHPFAKAAHDAFYGHFPLTISPDDVWFCLAQGFANHVNLNAETLRHRFVKHDGKQKLVVSRSDFELGKINPWPEVFSAFSDQVAGHVGKELRDVVVSDFSTTTHFHRAATEVVMMDTFQGYFEYEFMAGCGIPSITLNGAPDDWRDIRRRAMHFAEYGLERWVTELAPILDRIEATSRGFHDRDFWNSMFRYQSGSGPSVMTGWLHVLFPYLKRDGDKGDLVRNHYVSTWLNDFNNGISEQKKDRSYVPNGPWIGSIPSGLASAPVNVIAGRSMESHEMRFVAGMFGVSQDAVTKSLSPSFGWAIVYDKIMAQTDQEREAARMEKREARRARFKQLAAKDKEKQ